MEQELLIVLRFSIAREYHLAAVGGGQIDIHHLHGREGVQHGAGCQAGRQGAQAILERDLQAIG